MVKKFVEITKEEAKDLYCKYKSVYITTSGTEVWNGRTHWKLPASGEYGSHAPVEELFYRGVPHNEGTVKFFKMEEY